MRGGGWSPRLPAGHSLPAQPGLQADRLRRRPPLENGGLISSASNLLSPIGPSNQPGINNLSFKCYVCCCCWLIEYYTELIYDTFEQLLLSRWSESAKRLTPINQASIQSFSSPPLFFRSRPSRLSINNAHCQGFRYHNLLVITKRYYCRSHASTYLVRICI